MRTFDLSEFKTEADKMTEETFRASKSWSEPSGHEFQYLIDPLEKFCRKMGFPVRIKNPDIVLGRSSLHDKTLGLCRRESFMPRSPGTIFIHPDTTPNERARLLCHELTHGLGANQLDDGTEEITAEATAFAVCREFGLSTWNFSMPYVAYHRHCEGGKFMQDHIDKYASEILGGIDA